ncbi:hypothetical protein B0H66DRAFT_619329 [Apodospora peruviana]|uniref:Rhodopsin domain-containing protein n=1 Tax=Apodospora peruviana TaxID=516989 RepID=A0AAE0M7C1_9PEZI|nr:hypothetical protein B0H66DRAFT_619329 [Apodospora peruviana]
MDLSQLPPPIAPGLAYNSIQNGTVICFAVTYFFCTVFLGLRYFQALKLVKKVELDLVVLTLAYGASLVYFVTMVTLMRHGWGRHMDELSITDLLEFNKALLPNTLTYLITPAVTKMAMLIVLYRINPSLIYRVTVVAVGFAIFAYTLALTAITGGPCSPLKDGTIKCLTDVALAQSVLNIASDLAVLAIPLPTIHYLNFPLKTKFTVAGILAIGSGVVVCSIARLPYVLAVADPNNTDLTYTEAILGIWSIVEINLGVICGCAMRLKPLVVRYAPWVGLLASSRKGRSSKTPYGASWDARKDLRTDDRAVKHTYQLHSVQKGSSNPISEDGKIYVEQDSGKSSRLDNRTGGSGSTDSILELK